MPPARQPIVLVLGTLSMLELELELLLELVMPTSKAREMGG